MTRYVGRHEVAASLNSLEHPLAEELLRLLNEADSENELIPITEIAPSELAAVYRVRLSRSSAGEGPSTAGLAEFVHALELGEVDEMFGVSTERETALVLLAAGKIAAITTVVRQ